MSSELLLIPLTTRFIFQSLETISLRSQRWQRVRVELKGGGGLSS
jgi:hypothetical protein